MKLESVDENWEAFKSGHRESFGTIYQYYKPLLLFFCLGKVKNKELAESLASEALIKTFTVEKPAEIKNLEQWLFTVARNLCISHLRTVKRQHEILTEIYADKKVGHKPEVEGTQAQESIDQIIKLELNKEEYILLDMYLCNLRHSMIGLNKNTSVPINCILSLNQACLHRRRNVTNTQGIKCRFQWARLTATLSRGGARISRGVGLHWFCDGE